MSLQGHSLVFDLVDRRRFLRTGRKQISIPYSRIARKIKGNITQSITSQFLGNSLI